MKIYLASPIDDTAGRGDALAEHRSLATGNLHRLGFDWFDPATAYTGSLVPTVLEIYEGNEHALQSADGVLAILPGGVPSIGVPMEILRAHQLGKPVAVIGGNHSMQLKAMGVPTFYSESDAVEWLREQLPEAIQLYDGGPELLWVGELGFGPRRGYEGDAGYDLFVSAGCRIHVGDRFDVPCGISVQLPEGYWGLITGRSSTLRNRGLLVQQNVIDNGFRGELFAYVQNMGEEVVEVERGERICQLILMPLFTPEPRRVAELDPSERGTNAFGSTGN